MAGRSTESLGVTFQVERSRRINNAGIFPIIFIGAIAAASVVPVWMVASGATVSNAAPLLAFSFPAFLIALLIPVALMNVIAPFITFPSLRWVLIPAASAVIGFFLPLIVGFMFPVPAKMGGLAGLVGGVVCAGLWEILERRRVVLRDVGDA